MKYIVLLLAMLVAPLYAQIGPSPIQTLNTWRVEESYAIGQVVLRNGVVYQSLVNSNIAYDPAGSPSQWSSTVGSGGGPPTGNASGALSGTYPNPTIVGTTIQPKVINGISYSTQYIGATVDIRVNACVSDAEGRTNGNTSGVCDASGEGGVLAVASQINVGTSLGVAATLYLPCYGNWVGTMTDGTSAIMKQYGGTTVMSKCPSGGPAGSMVLNVSSASNLGYIYVLSTSSLPYSYTGGFEAKNITGSGEGHVTATGIGVLITGQTADATRLEAFNVNDQLDTYAVEVNGACCQTTWMDSSINSQYGGTPLYLLSNGTFFTGGFTFRDGTIVHPGPGLPVINCSDTTGTTVSGASFSDIYTETGNSSTAAALYQVNGCTKVSFKDFQVANYGTGAFTAVQVSNAYNSFVTVEDMWFVTGTHGWSYPVAAVQNNFTAEPVRYSDTNGYFSHYSTPTATESHGPSTFKTLSDQTLQNLGDIPYGGGDTGIINRLPANATATDEVLTSTGVAAAAPVPTAKTCKAFQNGVNTLACTWSASPAAGEFVVFGVINFATSTLSMTDSAGNVYQAVPQHNATALSGAHTQIFYFGPLAAPITTTTVTSTNGDNLLLEGNTTTNIATANPLDGQPCYADTSAATSSPCATALITTQANDFIFCDAHNSTVSDNFSAGSGFTPGASFNGNHFAQYQVQASVGATTPAITSSSAHPMTMGCASFLALGSTAAPILKNAPALSTANMIYPAYLTSALPSAATSGAGTVVLVKDATNTTPGTCTGSGTVGTYVTAVSNGTNWICP